MSDEQLTPQELEQVADLYVFVDNEKQFYLPGSQVDIASYATGFHVIVDSESDIICLAPQEKAELLARLINTYQTKEPVEKP